MAKTSTVTSKETLSGDAPTASSTVSPKQQRSRLSTERVLDASLELLAEQGFDAFTVAEAGKRAGMSVGAIYARFGDKQSMLRAVHAYGMERMLDQHAVAAGAALPESVGLREAVTEAVEMVAAVFHGNEDLLRAFMRLGAVDEVVSQRGSAGSQDLGRRFREMVGAHREGPDPDVEVDVAYRMAYSTFARQVNDGPTYESDLLIPWDELVAHVAAACAAYLAEHDVRSPA